MSETAVQETQETPNSVPTSSETQPTPPKRKRRWLRGLLLALVVLVCALAGFIGWLVGTESGLRFGLYKIPSWFGVKIASETLEGTLVKGFHGDKWMIETDGADVKISAFRFDWKPSELFQRSLHITEIVAGGIAGVPVAPPFTLSVVPSLRSTVVPLSPSNLSGLKAWAAVWWGRAYIKSMFTRSKICTAAAIHLCAIASPPLASSLSSAFVICNFHANVNSYINTVIVA